MALTARQVAEEVVRRLRTGEGPDFDMFAEDGIYAYPFSLPGLPAELCGRETIRGYYQQIERSGMRELIITESVEAVIRETDDPEVVITQITHRGWSKAADGPFEGKAICVIRVRDGVIMRYDEYVNPIAVAQMMGRTADLAAALAGEPSA